MKKFLFISATALCCFFISCNNGGGAGLSPTAQKNLDANNAIQKAFETKDFSKIGDYIAEDAVDHAGEKGDVKGLANMKVEFDKMAAMSQDDKTEVKKQLADDEFVMSWCRYTGKMKTDGMGMKAGDPFDMSSIEVTKFKDGKAIEHWSFMNVADMMKMMPPPPGAGAMPPMSMDSTKKDTTKKM